MNQEQEEQVHIWGEELMQLIFQHEFMLAFRPPAYSLEGYR